MKLAVLVTDVFYLCFFNSATSSISDRPSDGRISSQMESCGMKWPWYNFIILEFCLEKLGSTTRNLNVPGLGPRAPHKYGSGFLASRPQQFLWWYMRYVYCHPKTFLSLRHHQAVTYIGTVLIKKLKQNHCARDVSLNTRDFCCLLKVWHPRQSISYLCDWTAANMIKL